MFSPYTVKSSLISLSEVVLAQDARPFVPWMFSLYIGENSPIFTFCRMPDHLSQMERIISRTDSTTAENIYSTDGILWGIQTLQSVHCTVQSSHCTYCTLWGTYVVNCTDCALYVLYRACSRGSCTFQIERYLIVRKPSF